jgi:ATP-dependent DNA ligase
MREIVALPGDHTPALSRRAGCDGEAIVTNDDGLAVFDLIRRNVHATASSYFQHACALGCEGIVSKRLGSIYRCWGRSPHWIKVKNPNAPAVTREAGGGVGR